MAKTVHCTSLAVSADEELTHSEIESNKHSLEVEVSFMEPLTACEAMVFVRDVLYEHMFAKNIAVDWGKDD